MSWGFANDRTDHSEVLVSGRIAQRASTPFPFDVVAELSADSARVRRYLEEYFRHYDTPELGFTGRFFEQFIARSKPDRFTAFDLVAVSTLSVTIPVAAASVILLDPVTSASLNGLLVQAPPAGTDLADTQPDEIADSSPLSQLYLAIRQLPGMGPTKTSKLLASKRPGLVPIRDSVVSTLVNAGDRWWQPMRELARDQGLRNAINTASTDVVPPGVTFLRRLDVVLWRWGTDAGIIPPPDEETIPLA